MAKMYHDNGGYRVGCDYPTWQNGKTIYGENFKLTELQSAVALAQLEKINKILNKQRKTYFNIVNNIDNSFYKLRQNVSKAVPVYSSIAIEFKTAVRPFISLPCIGEAL